MDWIQTANVFQWKRPLYHLLSKNNFYYGLSFILEKQLEQLTNKSKEIFNEFISDKVTNDTNTVDRVESELFNRNEALKVVLLSAFARSGSTYLARLIASPPGSTYWHEPLRFLYEKPNPGLVFSKKNPGVD